LIEASIYALIKHLNKYKILKKCNLMISTYVSKIIASPIFAKSKRQRALLTYLINQMSNGNGVRTKGYAIASDVFNRNEDFDPTSDAIVRVEASRLREKLRKYYETYGLDDAIEISLPKGSYAIKVISRDAHPHNIDSASKANFEVNHPLHIPKLAIMPFAVADEIESPKKLSTEIAYQLIRELLELDFIQIIPRSSSFDYGDTSSLPNEIAAGLNAQYLLEGSIQKSKDGLKVMARLYSQSEKSYVWHDRFVFSLTSSPENFSIITSRIHKFLVDKMSPINAENFDLKDSRNPKAQQLVIKGMEAYWKYTAQHIAIAKDHFNAALKLEPDYACANAWLSRALVYEWVTGNRNSQEKLLQAYAYAEKSYALNNNSAYALSVLGWTNLWLKNHTLAIKNSRDAVLLDPNNTEALSFLSMILASTGATKEAASYAKRAIELNPYSSHVNMFSLGLSYFGERRFEEAQNAFMDGCALNNSYLPSLMYLCLSSAAINNNNLSGGTLQKLLYMLGDDKSKLCNSYFVHPALMDMDLALRTKAGLSAYLN
jgi:TolB-like protein/Tfp pilus assembly protein PilF